MIKKDITENGIDYTVIETKDGCQRWYKRYTTLFHRIGGPAIIEQGGDLQYWQEGLIHNLDGPAFIDNGLERFFIFGSEYMETDWETASKQYKEILESEKTSIEKTLNIFLLTKKYVGLPFSTL